MFIELKQQQTIQVVISTAGHSSNYIAEAEAILKKDCYHENNRT